MGIGRDASTKKESKKIDFICEELTRMFSTPCNFSPLDEKMVEWYGKDWCDKNCDPIVYPICWKLYFKARMENESNSIGK